MKQKIKEILKKILLFIANPRLLLCFGLAWIVTNGWSYIMFGIGIYYDIDWMTAVSGAYLAFLWLPISPEKIVTVAISIALLRLIFPNDKNTLGLLKEMSAKAKESAKKNKNRRRSMTFFKSFKKDAILVSKEGCCNTYRFETEGQKYIVKITKRRAHKKKTQISCSDRDIMWTQMIPLGISPMNQTDQITQTDFGDKDEIRMVIIKGRPNCIRGLETGNFICAQNKPRSTKDIYVMTYKAFKNFKE